MNTFEFFKNKNRHKSFVRKWAEEQKEKSKNKTTLEPSDLFAALMYSLAFFGKKDSRRKIDPQLKQAGLDTTEHYSGDASLFELGCYLYFRVDLWLFKKKSNLRDKLSKLLAKNFCILFSKALNNVDVGKLFNERINKYGEMIRNGEDVERYHFYLSQLILRTKDNNSPQGYNFKSEPLTLDFFGNLAIKTELIAWEKSVFPAIIQAVENYCKIIDNKNP